MPRQNSRDEDAPRRRRRASAVAIEADAERGVLMRVLLHSPKDTVAGALAFAAVSAIVANALLLQAGRHPAPLFGTVVTMPAEVLTPANPLPRPRPVEAISEPKPAEPKAADPKAADPRSADPRSADPFSHRRLHGTFYITRAGEESSAGVLFRRIYHRKHDCAGGR